MTRNMKGWERYCPKCGSTNVNAESVDNGEPRMHWCMDCNFTLLRAFPRRRKGENE